MAQFEPLSACYPNNADLHQAVALQYRRQVKDMGINMDQALRRKVLLLLHDYCESASGESGVYGTAVSGDIFRPLEGRAFSLANLAFPCRLHIREG